MVKLAAFAHKYLNRHTIATFIVLLFHTCGCIGMFTGYKDWFIGNTPLNLFIVFILIFITQPSVNLSFLVFVGLCFITGMVTEMVGIRTGFLFGEYAYGTVLGSKINDVPWLIGVNWFVVVYCSGVITSFLHNKVEKLYESQQRTVPRQWLSISFVIDAAMLTTFYDWVMEPVAVKLGFWTWGNDGQIPGFNYACWFIISALLLVAFRLLRFDKRNHFAVHLFIIQLLFFGVLRTFL